MKTLVLFLACLVPCALVALVVLRPVPSSPAHVITAAAASGPVNAVLGDRSFVAAFGRAPTAGDDEQLRIRTHLAYVERRLRAADVSGLAPEARAERARLLDVLAVYRERGAFPRAFPATGTRRPCFIDAEGRICAVGRLIEASEGRAAAEAIAEAHRYAYVAEMPVALLAGWAARSGFTLRELAMIQPAYEGGGCYGCSDEPILSPGVEQGALATGFMLAGMNTVLLGQDRPYRWLGVAGAVVGGGLFALGLKQRGHYPVGDLAIGGAALGVGVLQAVRPAPPRGDAEDGLRVVVGGVPDRVRGGVLPGGTVHWRF